MSPLAGALLVGLDLNTPAEMQVLRRILQPDLIRQVLAQDPTVDLPDLKNDDVVPPLHA